MRNFILTPHERDMIRKYLETGKPPKGFRTLIHRIKQNKDTFDTDFNLITQALARHQESYLPRGN